MSQVILTVGFSPSDLLPSKNGEEQTVQFLLEVVDILLNYVRKTFDRSTKVLDFHHPHQLLEGMEGFNLELSDHPESLEQILVDCRDTLKYGVRTGKGESLGDKRQTSSPCHTLDSYEHVKLALACRCMHPVSASFFTWPSPCICVRVCLFL